MRIRGKLISIWLIFGFALISAICITIVYAATDEKYVANVGASYTPSENYLSKLYFIGRDIDNNIVDQNPDHYTVRGTQELRFCEDVGSNGGYLSCATVSGGVIIPKTYNGKPVTAVESGAFYRGQDLTSVTIQDNITSIGNTTFYDCSRLTNVTIPEGVTSIGDSAFKNCTSLTDITIPRGVTSIGHSAFWGCTGLTSITIPDTVTSIDSSVFYGCTNLQNAIINGKVVGSSMFLDCSSLQTVTIGDNVTSIGDSAFSGCFNLKEVVIPDSVTSIGGSAFGSCGLTKIIIPSSVTSIGSQPFIGCGNLDSIQVETGNTKYHSVNNCLIETDTKALIRGCKDSIIPTDGSVISILDSAFYECKLTEIVIPDSVTSVGAFSFYYCDELKKVTIGSSVQKIGRRAFYGCSALSNVVFKGTGSWRVSEEDDGGGNITFMNPDASSLKVTYCDYYWTYNG